MRKLQRSLEAPQSIISPFTISNKKTPKFHDKGRLITTTSAGETAERLDLAYVLVKMVGWTGYNTLLYQIDIPDIYKVGYIPVIDGSPEDY